MILNTFKTALLLSILSGLLLLMGGLAGGQQGIKIALIMSLIMNVLTYFFSDKIVLKMYNAKPLDRTTHGWIYDMVSELARATNIPMPKLWLINNPMANAFATGRNPKNASVAVTTGILDLLEPDELRGVLAHELAHVKNRDILISTVAATIATAIGYLASMLRYAAFWGSMSRDNRKRGNPIAMIFVAILMPIAAMLVQLAISRSREYAADETGAHNCHDPLALASALEKLHNNVAHEHLHKDDTKHASTASLFIVHPFTANGLSKLFSTHPPMEKRIARLHEIHEKMRP